MQDFTDRRAPDTADELWFMEHHPLFTQGQAGKPEHLRDPGVIPVIQTDRGGQITWHGPGQLMIYILLDTRRLQLGARALVTQLEQSLVATLAVLGVAAYPRATAPGIYVSQQGQDAKLAALGLRIRKNGCYHGAALNMDCELAAFDRINPCGHAGMQVTRLADCLPQLPPRAEIERCFVAQWSQTLHYTDIQRCHGYD